MSCYSPMMAVPNGMTADGKIQYKFLGKYDPSIKYEHQGAIMLPCGKCVGCRADYAREWADRMVLELDHSKTAIFVTLTYNDENVPCVYNLTTGESVLSLKKRDLQLFFKRLRKYKRTEPYMNFSNKEVRYYASGEYGTSGTYRPHYHIILFGFTKEDFPDLEPIKVSPLGHVYYKSDILAEDIWKLGHCLITEVSWNTCAYVARYVRKKRMGLMSDEYVKRFEEPEFCVMSRNPGIGLYYLQEHDDWFEKKQVFFNGDQGSIECYFPKKFLERLEEKNPEMYQQLKAERYRFMNDNQFLELKNTDLSFSELNEIKGDYMKSNDKLLDMFQTEV